MASPVGPSGSLTSGLPQRVFGRLVRVLLALNEQQVTVLIARTLGARQTSYREIGEQLGVSAERARRVHMAVQHQIDPVLDQVDAVTDLLVATCGRVMARPQVVAFLQAAEIPLPRHEQSEEPIKLKEGALESSRTPTELAAIVFWQKLQSGFTAGPNGAWLPPDTAAQCAEIDELADALSDEYGLIREATLMDWLPSDLAADWIILQGLCALRRIGRWVVTASGLASSGPRAGSRPLRRMTAVAFALNEIGRPATYDEIKDQLARFDLDKDFRVDAVIAGRKDVVRAGKSTWGFTQWVDEVYGGISAAIEQRIADGGGRANLNALVEELSARFGVSASSVATYAHTDRYEVVRGFVQMADVSQLQFAPLDEVVDGYLTEGTPYWCFQVEERYFRGYSLPTVPPAVASFLGCGPDSSLMANVRRPESAEPVSVIWRTNAVHGPEIGRIADTLERLGAAEGDEVAVLLHGPSELSFVLHHPGGSSRAPARSLPGTPEGDSPTPPLTEDEPA